MNQVIQEEDIDAELTKGKVLLFKGLLISKLNL